MERILAAGILLLSLGSFGFADSPPATRWEQPRIVTTTTNAAVTWTNDVAGIATLEYIQLKSTATSMTCTVDVVTCNDMSTNRIQTIVTSGPTTSSVPVSLKQPMTWNDKLVFTPTVSPTNITTRFFIWFKDALK